MLPLRRSPKAASRYAVTGILAVLGLLMAAFAAASGLFSTGQQPYLQANSTNTSALGTINGRYARINTLTSNPPFQLGSISGARNSRGVEVVFYGTGTAGQTFEYTLVAVNYSLWANGDTYDDAEAQVICTGVATLGSTPGVGTRGAKPTDLLVNSITVVNSTYTAQLAAAFGSPVPLFYNGSDQAKLWVPDLGNATHVIVLFKCVTASSANCYLKGDS